MPTCSVGVQDSVLAPGSARTSTLEEALVTGVVGVAELVLRAGYAATSTPLGRVDPLAFPSTSTI